MKDPPRAPREPPPSKGGSGLQQLRHPRLEHTATALPDGRVLVTGGSIPHAGRDPERAIYLNHVEVWSPGSDWREVTSLREARAAHTATLLADGRVLLAGGKGPRANILSSVEIYDPATGRSEPAPPLRKARYEHVAVTLADGRVLVAGGAGDAGEVALAEVFEPVKGAWFPAGKTRIPRHGPEAACLPDGRVLLTGGVAMLRSTAAAEVWTGEKWEPAGRVRGSLVGHTMTVLADGRVMLIGGEDDEVSDRLQVFNGDWRPGPRLPRPRAYHTATRLPDGGVLLLGGKTGGYDEELLSVMETCYPDRVAESGTLKAARAGHRALAVEGGVLVVGGENYHGEPLDTSELIPPRT
ncbi:MAG: kelch repeat-containing protein [Candidatus Eremiobacterota bacterium]